MPSIFSRHALLVSLSLCLCGLATPAALAQDAAPPAEIAELVATCNACHGENGVPVVEEAPIIWGQENYYLYLQLRDIKSGLRASEIMQPIVAEMDKATMKALAQYFSEKKWPSLGYFTPESDVAAAEQAAVGGQCSQCHLGAWTGNSRVPRLAGQSVKYLEKSMKDFKSGYRKNAPDMGSILRDIPDNDLVALAHYAAGK